MLRYFYLLCLLVCIDWCFCYYYILDQNNGKSHERLSKHHNLRHGSKNPKYRDGQPMYQVPDGKDRVAEFDVANFIGQPKYEAVDVDGSYYAGGGDGSKKKIPKNYDDYGSMIGLTSDEIVKKRSDKDYTSLDGPETAKLNNVEGSPEKNINLDDVRIDKMLIHKPQKKYSLKFPFFSRKKAVTVKPKKGKRRKLCGRCTKTTSSDSSYKTTVSSLTGIEAQSDFKMDKRSYQERLCPICKKRFAMYYSKKVKKSDFPEKMFHNSRQYFQQNHVPKETFLNGSKNVNDAESNILEESNNEPEAVNEERRKRDTDAERQIKELDEVQKRIDNVDVTAPMYDQKGRTDSVNLS